MLNLVNKKLKNKMNLQELSISDLRELYDFALTEIVDLKRNLETLSSKEQEDEVIAINEKLQQWHFRAEKLYEELVKRADAISYLSV